MQELRIKYHGGVSDPVIYIHQDHRYFIQQYPHQVDTIASKLLQYPSTDYANNADAKFIVMGLNREVCTISLNKTEYNNALTFSPYATYAKYPLEVVKNFDAFSIKAVLRSGAFLLNIFCKLGRINQIAQVDNNLNSVLKHPEYLSDFIPEITQTLTEQYPHHAIVFFRVNSELDKKLLTSLKENNYLIFADRVTHLFYPEKNYMKRSRTKRDLSLLKNSNYQIVPHEKLTERDANRIHELYYMLFIDKYSKFNTDYSKKYFREAIQYRWQYYTALRGPDGNIDAFISWSYRDNVMICGPLGYNMNVNIKVGLYRQLILIALKHAHENQYVFNLGGGSDQFKTSRGSTPMLEYTAVYCQHLPWYRRLIWNAIRFGCERFLQKILKMNAM